jgi:DNA repair protein RadC
MNRIKETPAWDRPREKLFKNGPSYLSDEELVALILGSGTKGCDVSTLAGRVCDYLRESAFRAHTDFTAFIGGLLAIRGLGVAKVSLLVGAHELYARLHEPRKGTVRCARDVLPLVSFLEGKRQEHFVAIDLNGAGKVISTRIVTIGLVDQALVHPREVFAEAVRERAARVIVVHNHPAGALIPSEEDISVTKNLIKASKILGIALIDHIIVSDEGYFSFREENML